MDLIFVLLFGVSIGSFLNVLILRVPEQKSIVFPPSSCPKCGNRLKILHNIPILSYLFLRGKCGFCGEKISILYPIVEFTTAVIFLALFLKLGIDRDFIILVAIFSALLTLSIIDLKYKMIPDSISLSALALSVALYEPLESFENVLLMMGGFSALRFYISFILKKEAMGEGDIIIAGIMGAVLGVKLAMFAIFVSSLLALPLSLLYRFIKNDLELPFVPFLSLGTFLVFIFDNFAIEFLSYVFNN